MKNHLVIVAVVRPHLAQDCWCAPVECGPPHRDLELAPDIHLRKACFSGGRLMSKSSPAYAEFPFPAPARRV